MVTYWKYGHSGSALGGGVAVKNQWGDHLKFENQCHFQYDTTKSSQFLRLFTIIKLLIFKAFILLTFCILVSHYFTIDSTLYTIITTIL